jgi:hypothetical protein
LNGATVQGRAIVVNKSEPNQKAKESFNNNRGGETRWLWKQQRGGGDRGVKDINIFF